MISTDCGKPQKPTTKCLIINKKRRTVHYDRCKLVFDKIQKQIIVKPVNSNNNDIVMPFDKSFFIKQNSLFVLNSHSDSNKYALFFRNQKICAKLFSILQQEKSVEENDAKMDTTFYKDFLVPIIKELHVRSNMELKNMIMRMLNSRKRKEEFVKFVKNAKFDVELYKDFINMENDETKGSSGNQRLKRKLKATKFDGSHSTVYNTQDSSEGYVDESTPPSKRKRTSVLDVATSNFGEVIIDSSKFEIINYEANDGQRKKLIIFISVSDKSKCYEYSWQKYLKLFYCAGCSLKNKSVYARFCQKDDGTSFLKLSPRSHICEPREYNPEKYKFDAAKQIVEASNFKVVKFEEYGIQKSNLIIFPSVDRSRCYKYFLDGKTFCCSGCKSECNINVTAKVCIKNETKFVKLDSKRHVCAMKIYMSEKHIFRPSTKILTNNFKVKTVTQKSITRNTLII